MAVGGTAAAVLALAPLLVDLLLGTAPRSGAGVGRRAVMFISYGVAYGAVHGWVISRQRRPVDHASTIAAGLVAGPTAGVVSGAVVAAWMGWPSLGPAVILLFMGLILGVPLSYWFDSVDRSALRPHSGG